MNESEMKQMWQQCEAKLQQALTVNRTHALEITRLRISSELSAMKPVKFFAILLGIPWCIFLTSVWWFGMTHHPGNVLFAILVGLLAILNNVGLGMYIYHLVLMARVDQSSSVLAAQRELARLQVSTLQVARLYILQIPLYSSLHLTFATDAGTTFWVINALVLGAIVVATAWVWRQIDVNHSDSTVFKFLFGDQEYQGIRKSIDLLKQLEELKAE